MDDIKDSDQIREKKKKWNYHNFDGKCEGKSLCLDILSFLCLIDIQLRMYSGGNNKYFCVRDLE